MKMQFDIYTATDKQIDNLACELVKHYPEKADRLATMITYALQDAEVAAGEVPILEKAEDVTMTHLQGKFAMAYDALVCALGEPHYKYEVEPHTAHITGIDKTDIEWAFKLPSGAVCTVYNWKDGIAYCGSDGIPVEHLREWHVGGHFQSVVDELADVINKRLDAADYKEGESNDQ